VTGEQQTFQKGQADGNRTTRREPALKFDQTLVNSRRRLAAKAGIAALEAECDALLAVQGGKAVASADGKLHLAADYRPLLKAAGGGSCMFSW
jgi:hypothetical protein